MRKLIGIILLLALILTMASCGEDEATQTQTATVEEAHDFAHQAPPGLEEAVSEDMNANLQVIMSVQADPAAYEVALMDVALANIQASHAEDLAAGKYRQRDYRNINITVTGYTAPVANVLVEFDDYSVYVDASTGEVLDSPSTERKVFAMSVEEVDDRWKIKGIFDPVATEAEPQGGQ